MKFKSQRINKRRWKIQLYTFSTEIRHNLFDSMERLWQSEHWGDQTIKTGLELQCCFVAFNDVPSFYFGISSGKTFCYPVVYGMLLGFFKCCKNFLITLLRYLKFDGPFLFKGWNMLLAMEWMKRNHLCMILVFVNIMDINNSWLANCLF